MKKYNVAVMGATGLVGGTILNVLEERNFPIENLYLFSLFVFFTWTIEEGFF